MVTSTPSDPHAHPQAWPPFMQHQQTCAKAMPHASAANTSGRTQRAAPACVCIRPSRATARSVSTRGRAGSTAVEIGGGRTAVEIGAGRTAAEIGAHGGATQVLLNHNGAGQAVHIGRPLSGRGLHCGSVCRRAAPWLGSSATGTIGALSLEAHFVGGGGNSVGGPHEGCQGGRRKRARSPNWWSPQLCALLDWGIDDICSLEPGSCRQAAPERLPRDRCASGA